MGPRTIPSSNVVSVNESPSRANERPGIQPSAVLPRANPENAERAFYPEIEKKARILQWTLNRVAGRSLPGREYFEKYLRDMYRSNCGPNTFKPLFFDA